MHLDHRNQSDYLTWTSSDIVLEAIEVFCDWRLLMDPITYITYTPMIINLVEKWEYGIRWGYTKNLALDRLIFMLRQKQRRSSVESSS